MLFLAWKSRHKKRVVLWNSPYFPFLHFFSLFSLVDIIIRFKGEHMVNTCCSTTHGFLMFDCALLRTSWLPHVEHSRTTYIRIPWDASCITHVFHLVYIVYQIAYLFFSCILLSYPLVSSVRAIVNIISILHFPLCFSCKPARVSLRF